MFVAYMAPLGLYAQFPLREYNLGQVLIKKSYVWGEHDTF